jgi:hypothetical protein
MLTKIQKAKIVVQAMRNLPELPEEKTSSTVIWNLVKKESRLKMDFLNEKYDLAVQILLKRLKDN